MTKQIALFGALLSSIACGGTTDSGNGPFDGGTSSGGSAASSGAAGKGSSGSSSHVAGASQGGAAAAGTSSGGTGFGGNTHGGVSSGGLSSGGLSSGGVGGASGTGGTLSVDSRCPATTPSGACSVEGLKCEYNPGNSCLCASAPSAPAFCPQIDPDCTGPIREGSGGFSAKIAVPARQRCSCSADEWTCLLGI